MVMDQQLPIVLDFLGLGKLVTDDHEGLEEDASSAKEPSFPSIHGLLAPPANMDFRGVKYPVHNIGHSMEHTFAFHNKASEEAYVEGGAESYGRQWQGMVPGSNTAVGELPAARVLASDANAKASGMPLTIFYGGQINVYNNIHSDKAQALMNMAGDDSLLPLNALTLRLGVSHALGAQGFCQPAGVAEKFGFNNAQIGPVQFTADQASENYPAANKQFEGVMPETPSSASSPQPVVPRALPLARKASLARFLEKRKERMQMMMPYYKQQIAMAQGFSTGDQMASAFHGATLAKLYEEYYRRPSSMVFAMPEHMLPCNNDMPSCGIPAKE